ncbi:HAD family phosphatase [Oscillatoria sp. FACHB-1406]|uniref:HAD family hydrolase n=1 Tax=Oscillatoria sp. FACHB-1406 TaxID=2692846 RepID=UPI0016832D40|nr:HAD family phosphatase [Oscillatoria sp. FACHB-1406]MBD2579831.1 HAD family phosphatase [Oscillatoria sp. FACHB-1406]
MTLKAVLFDFNGVIINDEAIHAELISEILLGENLRILPRNYRESCLGQSDRACLTNLLALQGRVADDKTLKRLIDLKTSLYRQRLESLETLPIYPVADCLQQLQQAGLKIGLVTGAVRSEAAWVLDRAGLASYFSIIVGGDEIKRSKPDPYGYLLAVERLNRAFPALALEPANCLAIEDTFAGLQAAKSAGMQAVGIANTYPFHMLQRCSNWTIDSLADLELDRIQDVFARSGAI